MTQAARADKAIGLVSQAGGVVVTYDELAGNLVCIDAHDRRFSVNLTRPQDEDEASFRKYVDGLIYPKPVQRETTRWDGLLNHAILFAFTQGQIIDGRVDYITQSGKYVRVLLAGGSPLWIRTNDTSYDVLEDLGERIQALPTKPQVQR